MFGSLWGDDMYELTGRISQVSFDYVSGKPLVTFVLNEQGQARSMVDELKSQEKLTLKFGKFKQKRSLDANAYCWVLIGKIAEKTGVPKSEIYRKAIREIGGNFDIVCIKQEAAESLRKGWEHNGLGWQTDEMLSKLDGCTNVVLYYGSSTYDVEQMSRLIENVIQECDAQGIETKSQSEIDSLLNSWGGSK